PLRSSYMRSVRQRSWRTICFLPILRASVVRKNLVGAFPPSGHSAMSQRGSCSAMVTPSSSATLTRTKQKRELSLFLVPSRHVSFRKLFGPRCVSTIGPPIPLPPPKGGDRHGFAGTWLSTIGPPIPPPPPKGIDRHGFAGTWLSPPGTPTPLSTHHGA